MIQEVAFGITTSMSVEQGLVGQITTIMCARALQQLCLFALLPVPSVVW